MSEMAYTLHRGRLPLMLSMPHVGTELPADQRYRYTERALACEDTDWFLDRLYAFAIEMGASFSTVRSDTAWRSLAFSASSSLSRFT